MKIKSAHFAQPIRIKKHGGGENYVTHREAEESKHLNTKYAMHFDQGVLYVCNEEIDKTLIVFPSNIAYMEPFDGQGAKSSKTRDNPKRAKAQGRSE